MLAQFSMAFACERARAACAVPVLGAPDCAVLALLWRCEQAAA